MKRSVIQIANSTQLISLPRKWSLKFNIQKGDELEVEEEGNKLLSKTELDNILIKFVRMSKKKNQQKVIDEIKVILRLHNEETF